MKSVRGIEYDLIDALRRNPTIIQAGDDICGKAADEIERLRSVIHRRLKMTLPDEVGELAQIIRKVDGNNSLGAAALAEAVIENYTHE